MLYKSYSLHSPFSIKEKLFNLDFTFFFSILLLGVISIFAQFSSSGGMFDYYSKSHAIRFGVFFILFLIISFTPIRFWFSSSFFIFFILLALLIFVKFYGIQSQGSRRWVNFYIINLQPSELMKIGVILFLSNYYHKISEGDVNKVKFLLYPMIAILSPFILVISQPDLGTAILILLSGIVVTWLAGVRWKIFAYLTLITIVTAPIIISFLKPYQKSRILTFLNPDSDPLGAGYQIIQSKIAIGSGGLFGKGFLNGSQAYLNFLPEKHTDFIFTLYSEEFGFIGSIFMVFLYFLITYRIIVIGNETRSIFGKLYCYGFANAFFIYVTVNMSMVLGLLPIVGAPLPILSYGGSSMLAIMFGLGIVMSCKVYKNSVVG
ncbi:rod shape-determining protein RodA [Pelagibacteraceae bacterium]|nr:rod shape-determining protein RodA [Pelagibacteraceae bacterium]